MTYREAFQKTEEAKAFASFVGTKSFEAAVQAALLTMSETLTSQGNDIQGATANHFRMDGAHKLVAAMKNLVALQTPSSRRDPDNLKQ